VKTDVSGGNYLADSSIREYLAKLASSSPTPGGGSCAALSAALGAGLINMVCALTVGRKRFAQYETLLADTIQSLHSLSTRLTELVDEDAHAYDRVMTAFRLPRSSEDEKDNRRRSIQEALVPATETPLEIVECCQGALRLAVPLLGKLNPNVLSDLAAGIDLVAAAAHAASHNADVNIAMMSDDETIGRYTERTRSALAEVDALAARVREGLSSDGD
jgi:formiminotetrahydrofolate cyclodeaminase